MTVNRRGLFRQLITPDIDVRCLSLRPPGAIAEPEFLNACSQCGDCIKACPEHILIAGETGYVEVDFSENGCTACNQCIDACATGALRKQETPRVAGIATIGDSCLAKKQISCQSCRDACEDSAIRFDLTRATPTPEVITEKCSGCGFCVAICPATTVVVEPVEVLRGAFA